MNFCTSGLTVIETEAAAIFALAQTIDKNFERACELMFACTGRVVVTGMGKSGHIGKKIAATLASTGTPAFFMHPAEANHGDLGMVTSNDIVLALSNSGNTYEVLNLLPSLKRLGTPLITLTGNPNSILAKTATVNLNLEISAEACPLGLAPTTSTTIALVMGDALAVALLEARGFTADDFAHAHPGGALGKKLLLTVDELYHSGEALPKITETTLVRDALIELSAKKLGMACVVNSEGRLVGVYTDGDIRRTLTKSYDIHTTLIKDVMTQGCQTISQGMLAAEALALMQQHSITSLVITDSEHKPTAVLHIHDLLRAGMI
jgi:arabinose-5-phosphate isomerase